MKTFLLSFETLSSNQSLEKERQFIKVLNDYTIYADRLIILAKNDENGLIEALSSDYDMCFILNSENAGYYIPSTFSKCNLSPDKEGFCYGKKAVSIVPDDYHSGYLNLLENFLFKNFGVSLGKVVFKLYGISQKKAEEKTARITAPYDCVYYNVSEDNGDIKVSLIYGGNAPKKKVDDCVRRFILTLKNHIYAEDDISLSQRFYDIMKLRKQKVCTAESMTGGAIAAKIISIAGASDIFYEGLVTYDTLAKERRLNVSHSTVNNYTVVSEQVCYEMAKGLIEQKNCTLAITITGYAKSDIHPSKNDGLCFIGIATAERIQVYKYKFDGNRNEIINNAVNAALFLAVKTVENLDVV